MEKCNIILDIIIGQAPTIENKKKEWKRKTPMCIAAANRIIDRTNAQNFWRFQNGEDRVSLTGKRLQKLLYLCQLLWYADHDESYMITEDFQAWPNGPVIPQIYDHFKVYQEGDMRPILISGHHTLTDEEADLIDKVVDNTINIPTEAIIDYTHSPGSPWAQFYDNTQREYNTIPKDCIRSYIRVQNNCNQLFDFIQRYS